MKKTIFRSAVFSSVSWLSCVSAVSAEFQNVATTRESADLPTADFLNRALHYTNVGIALVFILFLLLMLASGIEFLMAGGDEISLQKAHRMWRIASLGITSTLIGYIVVNLIKFFL